MRKQNPKKDVSKIAAIIAGVLLLPFIIVWLLNLGLTRRYRFENYEEFAAKKTASPDNFGTNGDLGTALPLELIPPCARSIKYAYNLDVNQTTLTFYCKNLSQEELDNHIRIANSKLENFSWEFTEKFGSRYKLSAKYTPNLSNRREPILGPEGYDTGYERDASNVYYDGQLIPGADPKTFKAVGVNYSVDSKNAFFQTRIIPGADVGTFETIHDYGFAKDKYRVYEMDKVIPGADPNTYKPPEQG